MIRILDPGAGVGTLSAALCQRALIETSPRNLFFELWENNPKLIPMLERTMGRCQKALRAAGHEMKFVVRVDDFVLANSQRSLFESGPEPSFHLAILNPPYFKLRKDSPQARAMKHVIHGQPNIYAFFLAVAADLLLPKGEMVAITPRSYFNGPYFKRFRKWFFDRMVARQIHVFESRTEAFKEDAVLQENVILHAEKGGMPKDLILTNSFGRDLTEFKRNSAPYEKTIGSNHCDHVVRVPTSDFDRKIVETMDALPTEFRNLGYTISTGPVVPFRAREFLCDERSPDTAPLLWMHNVRPFITQFPPKNGKPTHIVVSKPSRKFLIPAKTYVLLKRFATKEEKRRLVAGIITPADSYSDSIGLENHLNYVYKKNADLTEDEAYGLAAFFNTAFVDRYFRAISGCTQVNAAEIRGMPAPDEPTIQRIGRRIRELETRAHAAVEGVVAQELRIPQKLLEQLIEVA